MTLKKFMQKLTFTAFLVSLGTGMFLAVSVVFSPGVFVVNWIETAVAFIALMFCAATLLALYEHIYVPESKKKLLKKYIG